MTEKEKITEIITNVKLPTVGGGCYSIEESRANLIAEALIANGIGLKSNREDLNSTEISSPKVFTDEDLEPFVGKKVVFRRRFDNREHIGILKKLLKVECKNAKNETIGYCNSYMCGGYGLLSSEITEIKEYEGE